MSHRRLIATLALTCSALVPTLASASAPAGVWALVEKVTLQPDANNPTMVRIDGVFMVANEVPDFPMYPGYSVPEYGYMYYNCSNDQIKTCVMEWKELEAASTSDNKCRGWGSQEFPVPKNGVVRPTGEPEAKPDLYPISMGVVQGFSPCEALKMWAAENPPPMEGGSSSGGETGSTGGSSGTGEPGTSTTGSSTGEPGSTGGKATTTVADTEGGGSSGSGGGPLTTGGGGSTGGGSTGGGSTGASASGGGQSEGTGCACDGGGSGAGALGLLFGALALGRRRRG